MHDVILDGEATGGWGRLGAGDYHVFDVLWLDGRDLTPLPLDERRAILARLPLRLPIERVAALDDPKPWERACAEGWEGVIAKRRDSKYEHRRSPHWLKMKCEATQELVVGGFTDPQGARVGLGALAGRLLRRRRARLCRESWHRVRHQDAARAAREAGSARDSGVAVHARRGVAQAARALGHARRSSCRSRSSSGRRTTSCGTRGCSVASAREREP